MRLVTIEVELKEGEEAPVANLEDGEHIEVRVTPVSELLAHLEGEFVSLSYRIELLGPSDSDQSRKPESISLRCTRLQGRRSPISLCCRDRCCSEISDQVVVIGVAK